MSNLNSSFTDTRLKVLDLVGAHIAILDRDGIILKTNKAWKDFKHQVDANLNRVAEGSSYFDVCRKAVENGDDYALKILLGIRGVLNSERESFNLAYPYRLSDEIMWFNLSIQPVDEVEEQFIMIHEDVTSAIQRKKRLNENKNRYQLQFEQSLDGIFITTTLGKILDANPAACEILGWSCDELLNLSRDEIIDTEDPNYKAALMQRKKSGSYKTEVHLKHKDGRHIPAEISSRAFRTGEGKLQAIVSFRDISRRKEAEEKLLSSLREKESLLSEIHHRVKNNLALINSIIELELYETNDKTLAHHLKDTKARIFTIADIHELLYQSESLTEIPFHEYLEKLMNKAKKNHQVYDRHLNLEINCPELYLNINQAIPFSMFLNELLGVIFNEISHDELVTIKLDLEKNGDCIGLNVYSDHMEGFIHSFQNGRSLSKILLKTLAKQLEAEVTWPEPEQERNYIEMSFYKNQKNGPASSLNVKTG